MWPGPVQVQSELVAAAPDVLRQWVSARGGRLGISGLVVSADDTRICFRIHSG
jgi:hypothetical protein